MSTSPVIVWTKLLGTSRYDSAYALTTGLDGSIYVSGDNRGSGLELDGQKNNGSSDAFLTKYSADGSKIWTRLLGASGEDIAYALTTGSDGSVYVSGSTDSALDGQTNGGIQDAFLTKYSPDGSKIWTKLLGTSSTDIGFAVTTGSDGAIYVSGYTYGSLDGQTNSGDLDVFLTKYIADGTKVWTKLLGGTGSEAAQAITTGSDGAIYVTGYTNSSIDGQTNSGQEDVFLTKYSADGTKVWTKLQGTNGTDYASSITTGLDGFIYVSGYAAGALDGQSNYGGYDVFLTKYSPDGSKVWTKLFGSAGNDIGLALTTGNDGAIYVSGYTSYEFDGNTNSGGFDAFLTKFSTDGSKVWVKLFGTSGDDRAQALTTGLDGSIYVGGYTTGNLAGQTNNGLGDGFILKFQEIATATSIYALSAGSNNYNEGSTATFTLTTTNLTSGTSVPYTLSGLSAADVSGGLLSGNAVVNSSGVATISVTLLNDLLTEGTETLTVTAGGASASTAVNDTSKPSYSLQQWPAGTSASEGYAADFSVTTTGVTSGSVLTYTISGSVNAADITTGSLTGQVTVGTNGVANISIPIAADTLTEGAETLTVTVQGQTSSITINDTSKTATYSLSASGASVNEGSTATFTLTTTNLTSGTSVPYTLSGLSAADVSGGSLSGNAVVNSSGVATISVTLLNDSLTEGSETLVVTAGGTSASTIVNDTSNTGGNVKTGLQLGTVSGVNLSLLSPVTRANGKTYYIVDLDNDGVITSADHASRVTLDQLFNNGNDRTDTQSTGAVAGVDDARTLIVNGYTLVNPTTTEFVALRSELGNVLPTGWYDSNYATATLVASNVHHNVSFTQNITYTNLNDTVYPGLFVMQVLGSVATYSLSASSASLNEGSTATFTLTTTNVASGTSVPYALSGVSAADITGGLLTGTATVNSSGIATISVGIVADSLTEGAETLTVTAGSSSTSITVNDTSLKAVVDDYPWDTATTGVLTVSGTAISGNIEVNDDRDLFKANLTAGTTYVFDAVASGAAALANPFLYLYSSSPLTLLLWDDDGGGSLNARITYTAPATGTYYVGVSDRSAVGTGTYEVSLKTATPTYALSSNSTSVNEGSTATFTLTTTNVASGTSVPYTLSGVSAADVSGGSLSGNAVVNSSGVATISVTLLNDLLTEGSETLTVTAGGSSASTTVSDTSKALSATYSLTTNYTATTEGSPVIATLRTTNVAAGTTLYYQITGTGITTTDLSGLSLTGTGVVNSSGQVSMTITLASDLATEGDETFYLQYYTESGRSVAAGSAAAVTIYDTSKGTATYSLSASSSSANEGSVATFTLTTTNVASGTSVAYTLSGVSAADVSGGSLSGNAVVNSSGLATISVTLLNDLLTEGSETLVVTAGGSSASTIVNDTSKNPSGTYSLITNWSATTEGTPVIATLSTTNVAAGTTLYYQITGTGITTTDLSGLSLTGTGVVNSSGQVSMTITLASDLATEGDETFYLQYYTESGRSVAAGSAAGVTIYDTSKGTAIYSLSAASASVDEGSIATFTLSTTNVAAGTSVAYTLSGVSASDITGGGLSGTATISTSGTATILVPIAADVTTEGAETVTVTVQGKTASITINDTSKGAATYALSTASASVDEGSIATFSLATTNVAAGTSLAYTLSGVSASDITGGGLSGTATVNTSGTATILVPIAADVTTEGAETLTVTVQGKTASITINDTSKGAATYALSTASASVDEGSIATFSLATTNVAAGTSISYTITGVSTADVTGGLTGTATVDTSGTATIYVAVAADFLTEGAETLTVTAQGKSASMTVNDTSKTVSTPPAKAWTKLLGTSDGDSAAALTTGLDGSIYVSGRTDGALDGQTYSGSGDAFLTKYSTDGTKAWTKLLGTSGEDYATALTTGLDGSIYVSGTTMGALDGQPHSGSYDAFIAKYSADGTNVWTKLLGTIDSDSATALTTGLDGSIFVSGRTDGALDGQTNRGADDVFLTKYSADGTKAWTKLLGHSGWDIARALTTGLDGSIYVSGYTSGDLDGQTRNGSDDAFLTKYSADGTKAWTKLLGTSAADQAYALTTGLDGSIYVSGYTMGALDGQTYSGSYDALLTKYSADGTKAWTKQLGTSGEDRAKALTTGLDGSIYISGYTRGALDGQTYSGSGDAFLTKYSTDGTKAWTMLLGSSSMDDAAALTIGLDGSIYVSGGSSGKLDGQAQAGNGDAFLIKFQEVGTATYALSAVSSSYNEGSTATFTLTTTNVTSGTSVPYTLSGLSAADVSGGSLSGNAVVNSSGVATISVSLLNDLLTEGAETLTVTSGGVSASTVINDTSKTVVTVPVVTATAAADTITNLAVSQSIDGGAGIDTLVYTSNSTAVVISKSGGNTVVTNTATGEVDTLVNVERLKFADTAIALDTSGVGGQAYRVYKAAFNRTPDVGGLGFWISGMDGGASLNAVAQGFVNSAEFKSVYGASPTNAQIVTRFYDNVLGRAAESGGYNYWLGVLDSGNANVAQVLASFSESAENQAGVIGLIGNGILYTPFISPTYSLVAGATSVNEGAVANFTLNTTNVAAGTTIGYTLSGVTTADVFGGLLSGSATINASGVATISVILLNDLLTEGAETLTVTAGGATATIVVNDTSVKLVGLVESPGDGGGGGGGVG